MVIVTKMNREQTQSFGHVHTTLFIFKLYFQHFLKLIYYFDTEYRTLSLIISEKMLCYVVK